jgi:AraC-like DNA-binding protein
MDNTPAGIENIHLYVWHDRFLYVGPSKATTSHRNHAAAWLAAPGATLHVTLTDGTLLQGEAVYIPSGTEYATQGIDVDIAALFWEPESASFRRAAGPGTDTPRAFQFPRPSDHVIHQLQNPATSASEADRLIENLFGLSGSATALAPYLDTRVEMALSFLRESPQHYGSIEALADKVHLSPSRLAHIFKEEVGVPVRRYVLWTKMRRALDLAISGESLTSAALSAGFSDSAHLSRTVRSMMGIAPEYLFRHRNRLVVHKHG